MGIAAIQAALAPRPAAPAIPQPPAPARRDAENGRRSRLAQEIIRRDRSDRPSEQDLREATLKFLRAIRDGGDQGVYGEALRIVLGLESGRALGGAMSGINRTITNAGFNPEPDVYHRTRDLEGRRWQPGRRIASAITSIEAVRVGD